MREAFAAVALHRPSRPENIGGVLRAADVYGVGLVVLGGGELPPEPLGHRQGAQRECNGTSAHDRPSAVGGTAPSARGGCGASSAAFSCRFRQFECPPGRQRRTARLETTVRRSCATTRNQTGDGPKIGPGRPRLGGRSWPGLRPRASSAARCAGSGRAFTSSIAAKRFSRRCSSAGSSSAFAPRGDATPNGDKERAPATRENQNPPTMR